MGKSHRDPPDLSLVIPCFNEEAVVATTVRDLLAAFERAGFVLEVVAVDNGSKDRTGTILRELAAADPRVVVERVEVNQGYGLGILTGLPRCSAPWIGLTCADGQVQAEDVVRLFARTREPGARERALYKVRRRFRQDGLKRKVVSVFYNGLANVIFGGLGSIDLNGNPKLFPRELLPRLALQSRDWFLDAEIMIKAKKLGLPVVEVDVPGQLRRGGASNVRSVTCFEFARNLWSCRFGNDPRATPVGVEPRSGARASGSVGAGGP